MADDDQAPTDPWTSNPRRMPDDLRQVSYAFEERTRQKLSPDFSVQHGRRVEATLKTLVAALGTPEVLASLDAPAPSSLVAAPSTPRGSRTDAERLVASLDKVQAERDAFAQTIALAHDETTKLRAQLAKKNAEIKELMAAVGGKAATNPSMATVEKLREHVDGLAKQNMLLGEDLKEIADKLEAYQAHGPVGLFAAYRSLGEPTAVQARERRLKLLVRLALTAFRSTHSLFTQYAATMGPLVVDYESRGRLLQQIFREAAAVGDEPLSDDVAAQLTSILPELVVAEPAAVSAAEALARLTTTLPSPDDARDTIEPPDDESSSDVAPPSAVEPTTTTLESLFGASDAKWLASLEADATKMFFGTPALHNLLTATTTAPDLRAVYETTVARFRGPPPMTRARPPTRGAHTSRSRRATRLTSPDADATAAREVVDLLSSPERRLEPWEATPFFVPPPKSDCGYLDLSTKAAFQEARKNTRTYVSAIQKSLRQTAWPLGDPVSGVTPKNVREVRETPWRLELFLDERTTPTAAEYGGCLLEKGDTRRFATFQEIVEVYGHRPWRVLMTPPDPVTFSRDDPRFVAFYNNARKLYRHYAKTLWERAHFILPASELLSKLDKLRRAAWSAARRRRNSNLRRHWAGHLQLIYDLFRRGVVDADFLLDPFLYWPPVAGVAIVCPKAEEDLTACINALDASEPERLFFCPPELRAEHVSWRTRAASAGRPALSVFDRIFGKFVPDELKAGFVRPAAPAPVAPTRRSLSDQFVRTVGDPDESSDDDFKVDERQLAGSDSDLDDDDEANAHQESGTESNTQETTRPSSSPPLSPAAPRRRDADVGDAQSSAGTPRSGGRAASVDTPHSEEQTASADTPLAGGRADTPVRKRKTSSVAAHSGGSSPPRKHR